jgi:hypothetical protein
MTGIGGIGNLRASSFCLPMEIRADIGAFPSASLASEARLDIGQPDVVRPSVSANCGRVAAAIVRAIDQETANTSGAHFSEVISKAGREGLAIIRTRTDEP